MGILFSKPISPTQEQAYRILQTFDTAPKTGEIKEYFNKNRFGKDLADYVIAYYNVKDSDNEKNYALLYRHKKWFKEFYDSYNFVTPEQKRKAEKILKMYIPLSENILRNHENSQDNFSV